MDATSLRQLSSTLYDSIKSSYDSTKITSAYDGLLKDFKLSFEDLGEACYLYVKSYDYYAYQTVKDSSILKEKMKDVIAKVFNDEIQ